MWSPSTATNRRTPVTRLAAYDAKHRSQLVETLNAWLDAFGDVPAAAASGRVHPNTFRYRIRRVAEVAGADLRDPSVRFALMLQLRLAAHSPPRPGGPDEEG
ncbi:PucR family transcriptional regulator [Streptomyces sp. NPDC091272]|uniref:PucR family transcriptional regulator n=1 Tax=Streptomyces sp. NPDC091272 TaxID=3365981 RepID=UPI003824B052